MKASRSSPKGVRDAAQRSRLSEGALQVLQPRIRHHHLPHGSRRSCVRWCRSRSRSACRHGQLRIHPHARFHRFRRLHRDRPGHPGALRAPTARCKKAATCTPCTSTTIRRSPAAARSGAFPRSWPVRRSRTRARRWSCTLHYGSVLCVAATMGYKHHEIDPAPMLKASWRRRTS